MWVNDNDFGGLDHVITPVGAVAKFAAAGKRIRKKDLGMIAVRA